MTPYGDSGASWRGSGQFRAQAIFRRMPTSSLHAECSEDVLARACARVTETVAAQVGCDLLGFCAARHCQPLRRRLSPSGRGSAAGGGRGYTGKRPRCRLREIFGVFEDRAVLVLLRILDREGKALQGVARCGGIPSAVTHHHGVNRGAPPYVLWVHQRDAGHPSAFMP